jgi:hypothetical protein
MLSSIKPRFELQTPALAEQSLLSSRPSQRLGKRSVVLDVHEANGAPRLTVDSVRTAFLNDGSESRIGLLCHNDPIDYVDPMGLDDTAPTYSPRETSLQKAEKDNSYNFIMGLMQRQFSSAISAGMVGYSAWSAWSALSQTMGATVTGQLIGKVNTKNVPKGNPNDRDAPTGLQKIGKINEGYFDFYQLQLVKGNAYLKDEHSYTREYVSATGSTDPSDIQTSNGQMVNMTRGVLVDRVGPIRPPSSNVNRTLTAHQLYDAVIYHGVQFPIHSEFDQITHIQNGVVTTDLIPTHP